MGFIAHNLRNVERMTIETFANELTSDTPSRWAELVGGDAGLLVRKMLQNQKLEKLNNKYLLKIDLRTCQDTDENCLKTFIILAKRLRKNVFKAVVKEEFEANAQCANEKGNDK